MTFALKPYKRSYRHKKVRCSPASGNTGIRLGEIRDVISDTDYFLLNDEHWLNLERPTRRLYGVRFDTTVGKMLSGFVIRKFLDCSPGFGMHPVNELACPYQPSWTDSV